MILPISSRMGPLPAPRPQGTLGPWRYRLLPAGHARDHPHHGFANPVRIGVHQAACLPVPDDDVAGPDLGADPLHQGIEADRIRPLHPGDDAGLRATSRATSRA